MGYPSGRSAIPLLYTASSTMFSLAWRAVPFLPSTSSSLRRSTSRSPEPHQTAPPPPTHRPIVRTASQMELRLSTSCAACGTKVSLEVPKWISTSIETAQTSPCRGDCDVQGVMSGKGTTAGELRSLVVEGAVGFANAVKSSPLLPIAFATVKAFAAFVVYLDARFLLREHAAHVAKEVATGLVEIEKELGLMRNAGEGLSIGWEALVKAVIALASSDPPSTGRTTRPDYPLSNLDKQYPYTRTGPYEQPRYYDEPGSPTYSSAHQSSTYRELDVDESGSLTFTPSSPVGTHLSPTNYVPPLLRRTPLSSPILRQSYLASGSSTPGYLHEARPAPSLASNDPYRPPSYSNECHDSFGFEGDPQRHRRSQSGPNAPTSSSISSKNSSNEGAGGSWPARTMLCWADKLMSKADTLHHQR